VYKVAIVQASYDSLRTTIADAKAPDIYKFVHAVDMPPTLPALDEGHSFFCGTHDGISKHIAQQLHLADSVL